MHNCPRVNLLIHAADPIRFDNHMHNPDIILRHQDESPPLNPVSSPIYQPFEQYSNPVEQHDFLLPMVPTIEWDCHILEISELESSPLHMSMPALTNDFELPGVDTREDGQSDGKRHRMPREWIFQITTWLMEHMFNSHPFAVLKRERCAAYSISLRQLNVFFTNKRMRLLGKKAHKPDLPPSKYSGCSAVLAQNECDDLLRQFFHTFSHSSSSSKSLPCSAARFSFASR